MNRVIGLCLAPDKSGDKVLYEFEGNQVVRRIVVGGVVTEVTKLGLYPRLHDEKLYEFVVYDFTANRRQGDKRGLTIHLKQVESGKVKTFEQATGNIEKLIGHMNSLTDDLCSQWFNERERKPKKEKQ